jgi:hypothetical protein
MYSKLYSRITQSSLMEEPVYVRYVFMMLLAVSDKHGVVIGTDVALARQVNISLSEFQEAINRLMAPDPNSNSKEEGGRRVLLNDGERGYFLVNYEKYAGLQNETIRREYMRDYIANYRAKGRDKGRPPHTPPPNSDTDTDTEGKTGKTGKQKSLPVASVGFERFWEVYPRKEAKVKAVESWKKHECEPLVDRIVESVKDHALTHDWQKECGQYIPMPTTFLNQHRWEDEVKKNGNYHPSGQVSLVKQLDLIERQIAQAKDQVTLYDTPEHRAKAASLLVAKKQIESQMLPSL